MLRTPREALAHPKSETRLHSHALECECPPCHSLLALLVQDHTQADTWAKSTRSTIPLMGKWHSPEWGTRDVVFSGAIGGNGTDPWQTAHQILRRPPRNLNSVRSTPRDSRAAPVWMRRGHPPRNGCLALSQPWSAPLSDSEGRSCNMALAYAAVAKSVAAWRSAASMDAARASGPRPRLSARTNVMSVTPMKLRTARR